MTTTTATTDGTERGGTSRQLATLAELIEAIDWRDVPTVSTYEAAAICVRIDEAGVLSRTDLSSIP